MLVSCRGDKILIPKDIVELSEFLNTNYEIDNTQEVYLNITKEDFNIILDELFLHQSIKNIKKATCLKMCDYLGFQLENEEIKVGAELSVGSKLSIYNNPIICHIYTNNSNKCIRTIKQLHLTSNHFRMAKGECKNGYNITFYDEDYDNFKLFLDNVDMEGYLSLLFYEKVINGNAKKFGYYLNMVINEISKK